MLGKLLVRFVSGATLSGVTRSGTKHRGSVQIRARIRLGVEALEDRSTPAAANLNQAFIEQMYQDVFDRPVDPSGLASSLEDLNAGESPTELILALLTAPGNEFLALDVNRAYQSLLDRPADPAGSAYFINFLSQGVSLQQVEADIAGSSEFYNDAGGTFILYAVRNEALSNVWNFRVISEESASR